MITLGVYREAGEHAAVIVRDGHVVSAVHDRDVDSARPDAVARALALAGAEAADLDAVRTARACPDGSPDQVSSILANGGQIKAVASSAAVMVVDDGGVGAVSVVELTGGVVDEQSEATALLGLVRSTAESLDANAQGPIAALESIAADVPPADVAIAGGNAPTVFDVGVLQTLLTDLARRGHTPAEIAASPHVETRRLRSAIANLVLEGFAAACLGAAERAGVSCEDGTVPLAGSVCGSPEFLARLQRRRAIVTAPVADAFGAALGAALLPQQRVHQLSHLALGDDFSEDEIKGTLENCRLEYLYEPHWGQLYARVSDLLSTGAIIGWFQGRADFSRQSFGSRSLLCDPGRRYSRENMNVFLLNRGVRSPLPLALLDPGDGTESIPSLGCHATDARVMQGRIGMAGAGGALHVHGVSHDAHPALHALLRTHAERTGVSALLNASLAAGGILASTPREAIREVYASAADALVIGRFLVAKDYWLLRGRGSTVTRR